MVNYDLYISGFHFFFCSMAKSKLNSRPLSDLKATTFYNQLNASLRVTLRNTNKEFLLGLALVTLH